MVTNVSDESAVSIFREEDYLEDGKRTLLRNIFKYLPDFFFFFIFYSCCSHLEHRASVKRFTSVS
jgi:hypothetical protein